MFFQVIIETNQYREKKCHLDAYCGTKCYRGVIPHGRGAAEISELPSRGAQYLTTTPNTISSTAHSLAQCPTKTSICASPETNVLEKNVYQNNRQSFTRRSQATINTIAPKKRAIRALPRVGWPRGIKRGINVTAREPSVAIRTNSIVWSKQVVVGLGPSSSLYCASTTVPAQ